MSKIYRSTDITEHVLVRLLRHKGYTAIVITWGDALSRSRGWRMETKEQPYLHLGYSVETAREKIAALPTLKPVKT